MEKLTNDIIEILEYLNKEEMKKLRKENIDIYKQHVMTKFESFDYFSILKLFIDNDDVEIEKLIEMIKVIDDINNKKISFEDANEQMKEKRASEYIYPQFGGKEAFEKKMMENKK